MKIVNEGEVFPGKVIKKMSKVMVVCLAKPFGISCPIDLEKDESPVFYEEVYQTNIGPSVKLNRLWFMIHSKIFVSTTKFFVTMNHFTTR